MRAKSEDIYAMLPSWWHAMPPNENQTVVAIAEVHDREFFVACIQQIHQVCSIPMKDMHNMRLCMECAWEHPSQLEMEQQIALDNPSEVAVEVNQAQAAVVDASNGLKWFQLKPPGIQGQELLDHTFAQGKISFKTSEEHLHTPNAYLDLSIKPGNVDILKHMKAPDLSRSAIMQDCAGNRAKFNLAARKLNQTGYVQRHYGLVNTEDKVMKLRNAI
jgi:hypothetical protein